MTLRTEQAALLTKYRRLRGVMRRLHSELLDRLPKGMLIQCAEKLGFMVDGTLVFGSEDEASVLMDYCLYDGWRGQHNAITRFLATQPYAAGSDEMLLLDAMTRARYSLFQVQSVAKGLGANCLDILRGDGGSIVDEGLGRTATEGVVFACRLIVLPDFAMTTGATIPLDADASADIRNVLASGSLEVGEVDYDRLSREEQAAMSSIIILCAFPRGGSSQITTSRPHRNPGTKPWQDAGARRPSRNDPCPCGSGKKYKRCCGRTG